MNRFFASTLLTVLIFTFLNTATAEAARPRAPYWSLHTEIDDVDGGNNGQSDVDQMLGDAGIEKGTFSDDHISARADSGILPFAPTMLGDPQNYLSHIPVVVWVNRAVHSKTQPLGQRAVIYVEGNENFRSIVSTGKPGHPTALGYFYGDSTDIHHLSHEYGSYMDFAVFWYRGFATHQAPVGSEGDLGNPASHGCVRFPKESAKKIYNFVTSYKRAPLPRFSRRGIDLGGPSTDNLLQIAVIVEDRPTANF